MSKPGGGSAFPGMHQDNHSGAWLWDKGMTLRQWYAGMAMMGILNNAESRIAPQKQFNTERTNAQILAENAFFMADTMLKEGERE